MDAVEWFLKMGSTVATVDEAIKFVQDNPKGIGDQGNYIFADADGNMAVSRGRLSDRQRGEEMVQGRERNYRPRKSLGLRKDEALGHQR